MATSPWYREGTAKFTQGSTTVTGTGTRWVDFVRAGDGIQGPDGKLYQVTNVASNTSLSITPAYGSETTYWTIPVQGYVKQLADAAAQLVRDFEGSAEEALDAADRAKASAQEAKASEVAAGSSANRSEAEADRSKDEADRAQQAADDAVSVVTDGGGSIEPAAGKWPVAGSDATIKQAWIKDLEFELDRLRVATNKTLYGDGPYPSLDLQFQGAKILDPRVTFARSTPKWDYYGKQYGVNEPVFTDKGLLLEPQRTNQITKSKEGRYWVESAPAYTLSDEELIVSTETGFDGHTIRRFSLNKAGFLNVRTSNTSFSYLPSIPSIFVRSNLRYCRAIASSMSRESVIYDLKKSSIAHVGSGFDYEPTIEKLDGGWHRISLVSRSSSGGYFNVVEVSDTLDFRDPANPQSTDDYIMLFGLQREDGGGELTRTSYIPTDGTQVTRAEDQFSVILGDWYSPNEGALVLKIGDGSALNRVSNDLISYPLGLVSNPPVVHDPDFKGVYFGSDSGVIRNVWVGIGGENRDAVVTHDIYPNDTLCLAWNHDTLTLAVNGEIVGTATDERVPMALHGALGFLINPNLGMQLPYLSFYNRALSDSEMIALTS